MLVVEGGSFLGKESKVFKEKHKEIGEVFKDYLLVCSPVKNRVALVNQEIDSGFDLKEGKESSLPLFVRSAFPNLIRKEQGEQLLEGWPGHERSTLFIRKETVDKQGRWYRDVDFKGNGYVHNGTVELLGGSTGQGLFGLLEKNEAFEEYRKSEEFLAEGIRTARVISIINIQEIIYGGKKIYLEKARKSGIVGMDFQPAILVRAFGTRARPRDISDASGLDEKTKKVILKDAKELVNKELGRGKIKPLSDSEYLDWFARTLGHNVGLMHRKGYVHELLTSHNVTLGVEICDLDSIRKIKKDNEKSEEKNFAINHCLRSIVESLNLPMAYLYISANTFIRHYFSAYHEGERRYGW